jgi:PST family polysaccharide transporter
MMNGKIDSNKIVTATKWSAVTEIAAKLVSPITNMVLARLLTPDAFGVVATITMIVSFVEVFTDAGFQKYLVQHEFKDRTDREQSICVAFWSNLSLSILIWGVIALFCEPLAVLVGNPGLGNVIVVASISIPLQAFSSIQIALFKRDFNFKVLFKARMFGVCTPLIVTVPLALWLKDYWALVIGTLVLNAVNAFVLTYYSSWKIRFFYSWRKLREMLSFTMWSMVESVSIWLTGYVDVFIIGIHLSAYYLGLYKTSMITVGQITALVTSATTPILFSALSRLQNDRPAFLHFFFRFQKMVGLLVIPLGVGIFVFRDMITSLLLGNQWLEAANFIGLWALTSSITIVLSHYSSEVYRSLGRPKLSVLSQLLHLLVLCPAMLIAVHYSYDVIYVTRALVRLELVLVNVVIMLWFVSLSPWQMLQNIAPATLAAMAMGVVGYMLLPFCSMAWIKVLLILFCVVLYFSVVLLFKQERAEVYSALQLIIRRKE